MTKHRMPQKWNTARTAGERPDLAGSWLAPENAPTANSTIAHKQSYRYWMKIHWATPPWMTPDLWRDMRAIYDTAHSSWHQVDHIVPLSHPLVCGLNVPWNLRVEPIWYNQAKSNNYWPDCPDHLCPQRNLPADMFGAPEPHQLGLAL